MRLTQQKKETADYKQIFLFNLYEKGEYFQVISRALIN